MPCPFCTQVSELYHYRVIKEVIGVDQTCKIKFSSVFYYSCESPTSNADVKNINYGLDFKILDIVLNLELVIFFLKKR